MVESQKLLSLVATEFNLGVIENIPTKIEGGLCNELWKVQTSSGVYAVKRMVTNASKEYFIPNIEDAFKIEQRAIDQGILAPIPIPHPKNSTALAKIILGESEALFRVHEWVEGSPLKVEDATIEDLYDIGKLIGNIHRLTDGNEIKSHIFPI